MRTQPQIRLRDGLDRVQSGLAGPFLEGFARRLQENGYSERSIPEYIRRAGCFGSWAARRGSLPHQLGEDTVEAYRHHLRRRLSAATALRAVGRVRRFLEYLVGLRIARPSTARVQPSEPPLLRAFNQWMVQHRGVAESTLRSYGRHVREFLGTVGDDPARYEARALRGFLLGYDKHHGRTNAHNASIALRAFLRFLVAEGKCAPGLDTTIPPIIKWRLSSLPRYLPADDVGRVLAACDTSTAVGRRDRAVLLLLVHLGLRANDVVRLRLDDIDWKKATLRVAGKARREARLPLPQEVGDAILAYLDHDRASAPYSEHLFLRAQAPIQPWQSSSSVSAVVAAAIRRAGVVSPFRGAHVLRHSAATEMLRQGATLDQIGVILRHRSRETTALYAKVDLVLLRTVAQPWPEGILMLSAAIEAYIALRRTLGCSYERTASSLRRFARFAAERGDTFIRADTVIEWSRSAGSLQERDRRLKTVAQFARHARTEDPRHEIPRADLFPYRRHRPVPFIFASAEIQRLVQEGFHLPPEGTLRPLAFGALFSLLAATGLRIGEALRLRLADVTADGLLIRCTKFRKSRLVPLHETAVAGLGRYLARRQTCSGQDDLVFVDHRGRGLLENTVRAVVRRLVRRLGLVRGPEHPTPHIHSLRHYPDCRIIPSRRCRAPLS